MIQLVLVRAYDIYTTTSASPVNICDIQILGITELKVTVELLVNMPKPLYDQYN